MSSQTSSITRSDRPGDSAARSAIELTRRAVQAGLERAAHRAIGDPGKVRTSYFSRRTRGGQIPEWGIPVQHRIPLDIGKGDSSKMFGSLGQIEDNSVGAAIAVCTLVAQEPLGTSDEKARSRARKVRSTLLRQTRPNPASLHNVENGVREARGSSLEHQLYAGLAYWEEHYLRLEQELPTAHTVREIAEGLSRIANGFAEIHDGIGESSARAMLTVTYLVGLGEFNDADRQMRRTFVLFRDNYEDRIIQELFRDVKAPLADELADGQARQHSRPSTFD